MKTLLHTAMLLTLACRAESADRTPPRAKPLPAPKAPITLTADDREQVVEFFDEVYRESPMLKPQNLTLRAAGKNCEILLIFLPKDASTESFAAEELHMYSRLSPGYWWQAFGFRGFMYYARGSNAVVYASEAITAQEKSWPHTIPVCQPVSVDEFRHR